MADYRRGDGSAGRLPEGATIEQRIRHSVRLADAVRANAAPPPSLLDAVTELGPGIPRGGARYRTNREQA